jgi:hypothetical protein
MTTPTQNLLAWIDERIEVLNALLEDCKSMRDREGIDIRLYEVCAMRHRILQEVENEKAVIKKAYTDGNRLECYDATETICKQYYQTTFNPNNDEQLRTN